LIFLDSVLLREHDGTMMKETSDQGLGLVDRTRQELQSVREAMDRECRAAVALAAISSTLNPSRLTERIANEMRNLGEELLRNRESERDICQVLGLDQPGDGE
jgi:hypothetical protein